MAAMAMCGGGVGADPLDPDREEAEGVRRGGRRGGFDEGGSWQQWSAGSARGKRLLYGARRALVGVWRRQEGSEGRYGWSGDRGGVG